MTTPLPPAGWYPDPTGKSSQMYWDGRGWHTPSPAIPAMTRPAYAHSPGRSSSGRKVMLVIAGLLVIAGVVVACGGSTPGKTSDEDQIRALMQREQTAQNNLDYTGFLQTLCAALLPQQQNQTTWVDQDKASIDAYGPIEYTVTNIKVSGDTATANTSTKGQREPESRRTTSTSQFARESGAWKDCSPAPPSG
jgi:hypothetical protein